MQEYKRAIWSCEYAFSAVSCPPIDLPCIRGASGVEAVAMRFDFAVSLVLLFFFGSRLQTALTPRPLHVADLKR